MAKRVLIIGLAVLGGCGSAQARDYLLGGGRVTLEARGGVLRLIVTAPSSMQRAAGLVAGDVLFDGEDRGGRIVGTARYVAAGCRPVGYRVEGDARPDARGRIVLRGAVPVLEGGACRLAGRSERAPGSMLVLVPAADNSPDRWAGAPEEKPAATESLSAFVTEEAATPPFSPPPPGPHAPSAYNTGGIRRY